MKLFFHDAANVLTGTFPVGTQSATVPNNSAETSNIMRTMDGTVGVAQASLPITFTTIPSSTRNYYSSFCSPPLIGAQTVGGGLIELNGADSESDLTVNTRLNSCEVYVWRPSTGAKVGTILAVGAFLGGLEPTLANSEQVSHCSGIASASVAALDGDVIIVELWERFTPSNSAVRTTTIFYDGTTENTTENAVVTSQASYIELLPKTATKLFFHDAANVLTGTFPVGTQSATVPNNSAATSNIMRTMDETVGVAQASLPITFTSANTPTNNYYSSFCSPPLLGNQTVGGSLTELNGADSESNLTINAWLNSCEVYVWRPSTDTKVGTILAVGASLGGLEPTSTNSEQVSHCSGIASASVAALDGDVIIVELWESLTSSNANIRTTTIFYDGTTEDTIENAVVTSHASYCLFNEVITFKGEGASTEYPASLTESTSATVGASGSKIKNAARTESGALTSAQTARADFISVTEDAIAIFDDMGARGDYNASIAELAAALESSTAENKYIFVVARTELVTVNSSQIIFVSSTYPADVEEDVFADEESVTPYTFSAEALEAVLATETQTTPYSFSAELIESLLAGDIIIFVSNSNPWEKLPTGFTVWSPSPPSSPVWTDKPSSGTDWITQ